MNPSTGTFISQDAYQGAVYDPVSLHKYLYANANPVMYTDPSGYATTLSDMSYAMTIQSILTSGLISGSISAGMSIIRDLTTVTDIEDIDVLSVINNALYNFLFGFFTGTTFSIVGFFAYDFGSVIILRTLGITGLIGSILSFYEAIRECRNGNEVLAAAYATFGIFGIYGSFQIISAANSIIPAKTTASSVTDTSPDNTTTASANAPSTSAAAPKTPQDLIDESNLSKKAHSTTQYEKPGDYNTAKSDFDSLQPNNVTTYPNKTIVGYLPDGRIINVRSGSSKGTPTIEIKSPNSNKRVKIRYTGS
jgi:hypothetical protein